MVEKVYFDLPESLFLRFVDVGLRDYALSRISFLFLHGSFSAA